MKPSLAKGTRDFDASEMYKRQYVMQTLSHIFEEFGFEPLETPAFENLETLTGKYGEEGDRLIFKILKSGLNQAKDKVAVAEEFSQMLERAYTSKMVSDKALRYDLTVPLARYVSMNEGKLAWPYKRYQIQAVWRADRPQKGRFREFYQCDADAVGSESLLLDTEMILLYAQAFKRLQLPITIHYNNRKILEGLAQFAGIQNQLIDFTVALDKLDKIGKEGVIQELESKGISQDAITLLEPLFQTYTSNEEKYIVLEKMLENSDIGLEGLKEAKQIIGNAIEIGVEEKQIELNITLARGLDYYTGSIYEVKANEVEMGSIGGGGRYNNLTELFGVKDKPGIGISFGLDRIILVMEELNLFKNVQNSITDLLFLNFSEKESIAAEKLMIQLREIGVKCEIYPESTKLKKQFTYAEKKGISYVAFYGEKEQQAGILNVKNIESGEQKDFSLQNIQIIQEELGF